MFINLWCLTSFNPWIKKQSQRCKITRKMVFLWDIWRNSTCGKRSSCDFQNLMKGKLDHLKWLLLLWIRCSLIRQKQVFLNGQENCGHAQTFHIMTQKSSSYIWQKPQRTVESPWSNNNIIASLNQWRKYYDTHAQLKCATDYFQIYFQQSVKPEPRFFVSLLWFFLCVLSKRNSWHFWLCASCDLVSFPFWSS